MRNRKSQQGASLLLFMMALIAAGAAFFFTTLSPEQGRTSGQNQTSKSLATAKEVLLAHAVTYYYSQSTTGTPRLGIHGMLPCPEIPADHNGAGNSSSNCGTEHTNSLGRFPWKTSTTQSISIGPLKDSAGECLWYAVSGGFYNNPHSKMSNDDTPGMFQVLDENGNIVKGATPEDRVVAVIIAPGKPLSGQTRPAAQANEPCNVDGDGINPASYLDSYNGVNNAAVSINTDDQIDQFISASSQTGNDQLNDRIITISTQEIYDAIKTNNSMYVERINHLADGLVNCLVTYADDNHTTVPGSGSGGGDPDPDPDPGSGGSCTGGSLSACRDDCDAIWNLCRLSASPGQQTRDCNNARQACRSNCRDNCPGPGPGPEPEPEPDPGGGGSNTAYQFPWPAPLDLGDDYRFDPALTNSLYASQSNLTEVGRWPTDITNSNVNGVESNLFDYCVTNGLDQEQQNLWRHWQDHFFYVVHGSFDPTNTAAAQDSALCNPNCLTVNGNNYAALLIFSGERLEHAPFNQLRRDPYVETGVATADSKTQIDNYLEGSNTTAATPFSDYTGLPVGNQADVNDRIYCISASSAGSSPGYTYDLNQMPVCN